MSLHRITKAPGPGAYERLLLDVVRGAPTLFMRNDEVEAAWAWIEPRTLSWATLAAVMGRSARSTLSFSSRTASASRLVGGSIAVRQSSCKRWFCTISRSYASGSYVSGLVRPTDSTLLIGRDGRRWHEDRA